MPAARACRATVSSSQASTWLRGWVMTCAPVASLAGAGERRVDPGQPQDDAEDEQHGDVGDEEEKDAGDHRKRLQRGENGGRSGSARTIIMGAPTGKSSAMECPRKAAARSSLTTTATLESSVSFAANPRNLRRVQSSTRLPPKAAT
jgi:hypothetical protein